MAEITWTAEAERWLKDIYDYIGQDNREAANPVIESPPAWPLQTREEAIILQQ
jgi:hypothetical protein